MHKEGGPGGTIEPHPNLQEWRTAVAQAIQKLPEKVRPEAYALWQGYLQTTNPEQRDQKWQRLYALFEQYSHYTAPAPGNIVRFENGNPDETIEFQAIQAGITPYKQVGIPVDPEPANDNDRESSDPMQT